jgi:putative ABC transport system ATP-binding protein
MSEAMIELSHVEKVYHRDALEIPVLRDVNLKVPEGEFVALMGPSGSGKTTLLNLIAGIDQPTRGRIVVGGRDISQISQTELARWRSSTIGFIFQLYNLIPVLTAFENVELPLLLTKLKKAERRKHVEAALSIVNLSDRVDHYPRQLSGGQEQRVAIARAVVSDPAILVADEPTGDLDAKSANEILELLNRLNQEFQKTIVMVTHDPKAAGRAHRMVHLDKGVFHAEELTEAGTLIGKVREAE